MVGSFGRRRDAALRTHALAFTAVALGACSSSGASGGHDAGGDAVASSTPEADAYVWGYPLVVTERTMQTLAALVGGINQLYSEASPSTPGTRLVVSPNVDTLYSLAVLDLRAEPMVLTVPDVTDRYWTCQFLDAWTNSFDYIGTRATAGKGGTFVVTAPGWTGALPAGATTIASPTPQAFLLGRYLYRDAADVANVNSIVRTLAPLHSVMGGTAPPAAAPIGTSPGSPQQVGSSGGSFYDELGDALAVNPPATAFDMTEAARFASLGIGAGLHPFAKAMAAADSATSRALAAGVTSGNEQIASEAASSGMQSRGWTVHLDVGTYTNDALLRAATAQIVWGANVPQEAVYAFSLHDSAGAPYDGAKSYVVHFAGGQLPPHDALGFWSLTMYGPDHFLVANDAQVYAVSDRTAGLVQNADGSLDVFVQSASPAGGGVNWLPAPTSGPFQMILRIYLPSQTVAGGTYSYPTVTAGM